MAVALYAYVLPQCYLTAGNPRAASIAHYERLEAENFGKEAAPARVWVGGKLVDAETAATGAGSSEFDDIDDSLLKRGDEDKKPAGGKDDWKKAFEGTTGTTDGTLTDEDGRALPAAWLPDAVPCAMIFGLMTATALFFLLCHWLVSFKALALFSPTNSVKAGSYLFVQPHPHRGKAQIVKVSTSETSGALGFLFQRQKYDYLDAKGYGYTKAIDKLELIDTHTKEGSTSIGAVKLVVHETDKAVGLYARACGMRKEGMEAKLEMFGKNEMRIPPPRFLDLFKSQLLAPIAIFQLFCAILWMLDEYWQYTIFTLFSIFMLEATTAFQRLRTFNTLGNMASKPTPLMVYRDAKWHQLTTTDLVPGDLISLTRKVPEKKAGDAVVKKEKGAADSTDGKKKSPPPPPGSDVVPCDLLVLSGSAVVNEATLTGESVPQMKDALKVEEGDEEEHRPLDIEGRDRVHTLFSGTTVVVASPGTPVTAATKSQSNFAGHNIATPDGGALCFVLRTGFSSSQGELMQMIEFSTEQVSADSAETGFALLILLCFALVSAGYVLKTGLEKGDRTTHELLLKCVIIITSVVPRQLPMQMAMAVNTALMALMKNGIFCTEPFRVPFAGKINHCLFDKTGTLTTDQLMPCGVVNNMPGAMGTQNARPRVEVNEARPEAALVLGACHSLVDMEGVGVVGDPIEIAALKGIEWRYDAVSQTAKPGDWESLEKAVGKVKEEQAALAAGPQNGATKKAQEKNSKKVADLEKLIKGQKTRSSSSPVSQVKIVQRHHFSSELQRMSVVVDVQAKGDGAVSSGKYCLVKGSPEAVLKLLATGNVPAWYEASYNAMAEEGMRVLALAYKRCPNGYDVKNEESRSWVEADLSFGGFIAFTCKTRADSPVVIRALNESSHHVAMVTGDAALTALHVARGCGVTKSKLPTKKKGDAKKAIKSNGSDEVGCPLMLTLVGGGDDDEEEEDEEEKEAVEKVFTWSGILKADEAVSMPLEVGGLTELAKTHDLVVVESVLEQACEQYPELWDEMAAIRVFARCSPQGKARVIRAIQAKSKQNHVLMCGDGGNDVGALKQADVGLALLSGYGNTNTTDTVEDPADAEESESALATTDGSATAVVSKSAEDQLNAQQKELEKRAKQAQITKKTLLAKKQKELMAKQQEWLQEELKARGERGEDTGVMGTVQAVKTVTMRIKNEMAKEGAALNRKHGNVFDTDDAEDADPMAGLDEAMPVVRPGDASVAAPFTSRTPSIRSVVNLIRQGRCTLLSALQQQQIMMLECIISAYALSALSLEGARSSERQMVSVTTTITVHITA